MAKSTDNQALVPVEQIERSIHVIREQRVMLDFDLAKLYGIPTHVLNQAVKRNRAGSPAILRFRLRCKSLET
jgi:ORF6N domain